MLIMETKNKLNYEVTFEQAYVDRFVLRVDFSVDGKEYIANCYYWNGNDMSDYEIEDDNGEEVEDEAIVELGHYLLHNMEVNKDTISW
jgi:hypothetical protein